MTGPCGGKGAGLVQDCTSQIVSVAILHNHVNTDYQLNPIYVQLIAIAAGFASAW
jgi:hypothetical protein